MPAFRWYCLVCLLVISPPNTLPIVVYFALVEWVKMIWCACARQLVLASKPLWRNYQTTWWVRAAFLKKSRSARNAITFLLVVQRHKQPLSSFVVAVNNLLEKQNALFMMHSWWYDVHANFTPSSLVVVQSRWRCPNISTMPHSRLRANNNSCFKGLQTLLRLFRANLSQMQVLIRSNYSTSCATSILKMMVAGGVLTLKMRESPIPWTSLFGSLLLSNLMQSLLQLRLHV
mmetsp:Transcript_1829/g.2631  ORF Transcript_1829/g.2631 Transcript_1829/m.2631 type:complete len:231 (+) Transcript_1829:935-1627(+)